MTCNSLCLCLWGERSYLCTGILSWLYKTEGSTYVEVCRSLNAATATEDPLPTPRKT